MPRKKTKVKERKGISKYFSSRRGAFRGFKRDYDISNSEQPKKVISADSKGGEYYNLDERNRRMYIFGEKSNMFGKIKRKETHLREDKDVFYAEGKGNQKQHFNAGFSEGKLKDHYYFKKKEKEVMISLKTSSDIFHNKRVILDYLGSELFKSDAEIGNINWLELTISGEDNEDRFQEFLEAFFSLMRSDFLISIFCYERSEKLKSRLRSYGKLFHELRKEKFVGDQFLIEKELDTDKNHSVFTGIIRVDETENEIILNEILGTYFKFGYAELVDISKDNPNRLESLMESVDFKLLRKGALIEVDYLTLLSRLIVPTSMVFSYLFDGKDDLIFTVYSGNKIFSRIEQITLQSLPEDIKLDKTIATSKEVDRLIDSYFKDWRTV